VGKSYTARRFAEQLYKAGQQIVIVDPKGDWWGIRSSADGKGPGLPVVILGGERGDVPLEVSAGEVVAKLVAEDRVSALLDLSLFRKHEVATFMTAFLESLYRIKAREVYRTPLMLLIDEADAIAPQKPQENEARMLGAAEDIVRRGGQRGLGCTLITQRSAVLNKNVLTQVEMIITLRTIAPQDLKAMDAWIEVHGEQDQRATLMSSLPALPVGDAWFWSPGWPTAAGIFERVHVLPIETFDSGASPKAGEKRIEPKNLADVDLGALTKQMSATIEKAKANDPKLLRQRVTELERELARKPAGKVGDVSHATMVSQIEASVEKARTQWTRDLKRAVRRDLDVAARAVDRIVAVSRHLEAASSDAVAALLSLDGTFSPGTSEDSRAEVQVGNHASRTTGANHPSDSAVGRSPRAPARPIATTRVSSGDTTLPKGERIMLTAIAQYPDGAERDQLSILTGYKRSSRDSYIQRLQSNGHVEIDGALIRATDSGMDALGADFEPLPTGKALQAYWLERLSGGERAILEVLLEAYPKAVQRDALDDRTGYKRSSRDSYIQRLGARKLIDTAGRGEVRASQTLFE
jgi:hypothetical protein